VAFGLERIAFAFLAQFGLDPANGLPRSGIISLFNPKSF